METARTLGEIDNSNQSNGQISRPTTFKWIDEWVKAANDHDRMIAPEANIFDDWLKIMETGIVTIYIHIYTL